jgi:hypothetical protein
LGAVRLDRPQQIAGYAGSALAAVAFVVLAHSNPLFLAVGLLLCALLAFFVRRGASTPAAVAAVGVSFGPWGVAYFAGPVFLCYAGWVMFTASRERREQLAVEKALAKAEQEKEAKAAPRPPGARPTASKRYTPPAKKPTKR